MLRSDEPRYCLTIPRKSGDGIDIRFDNVYELLGISMDECRASCDDIVSALVKSPICAELFHDFLKLEYFMSDLVLADKKDSIVLIGTWLATEGIVHGILSDYWTMLYVSENPSLKTGRLSPGAEFLLPFVTAILREHPDCAHLTLSNVQYFLKVMFKYTSPYELNRMLSNYLEPESASHELKQSFRVEFINLLMTVDKDTLITIMPELFKNPNLDDVVLDLKMNTWEKLANHLPNYRSELCAHYREMAAAEGMEFTSLLVRAEIEGRDTKIWLEAGEHPNQALRLLVARCPQHISIYQRDDPATHLPTLEQRIRYLQYGADSNIDRSLIRFICAINHNEWRRFTLQRALKFYHSTIYDLLSIDDELFKYVYDAFPNAKKYVNERGVGTLLPSFAEDWLRVTSAISQDNFALHLKSDREVARNIYLNFCLYLSSQKSYPAGLHFDVIFMIMEWVGLDKSSKNESRALYAACQEQSELIKEMSKTPGGINVCQRNLENGQFKFTFFKSFETCRKDYERFKSKLKKTQTRSLKEALSQEFSADAKQQLSVFEGYVEIAAESQQQASGLIQKRILQNHLQHSPLYQKIKQTDELMSGFEDLAPKAEV
jgi:hypothetical protein